jgi:hypothetical protein
MVTRVCACGCGEPALPRKDARYASRACKTRDWKRRHGIVGYRAVKVSRRRKSSGLQAAHGRVRHQMKILLILVAPHLGPERIDSLADAYAANSLSVRQRAELHAREQRSKT